MRHLRSLAIMLGIVTISPLPATAQNPPGMMGGMNGMGGAGSLMGNGNGMMGGILPSLASSSTGNVAGVLSYCVQNRLVQGTSATSTLNTLTGASGITSSNDYAEGRQGQIQSGNGKIFSLGGMNETLKARACDLVLKHAQSLLPTTP